MVFCERFFPKSRECQERTLVVAGASPYAPFEEPGEGARGVARRNLARPGRGRRKVTDRSFERASEREGGRSVRIHGFRQLGRSRQDGRAANGFAGAYESLSEPCQSVWIVGKVAQCALEGVVRMVTMSACHVGLPDRHEHSALLAWGRNEGFQKSGLRRGVLEARGLEGSDERCPVYERVSWGVRGRLVELTKRSDGILGEARRLGSQRGSKGRAGLPVRIANRPRESSYLVPHPLEQRRREISEP